MENKVKKISRFPSIDIIRGFALFSNVFVHIFVDVFDLSPIVDDGNLFKQPLSILLLFVMIGYLGSFGSLFIIISGSGSTISMYKGIDKGKTINSVISKQIIGGILLIIFSFLVEGVLQYWGLLGSINSLNGHHFDPRRAIWHAYVMSPVLCLAVSMVISGVVQYFLFQNEGEKKHKRNIIIYILLSIIIIALSQWIWDLCKQFGPDGFPNARWPDRVHSDHQVFMPPLDASFVDLVKHFFLTLGGGSNHPIFPFVSVYFAGNIFGILLIAAEEKKETDEGPNPHVPKYIIFSAIGVFIIGIIFIPLLGVDFNSILPIDSVGDITLINGGLDGFWIPWFCFLFAGEIFFVAIFIRLIEYRGLGKDKADQTTFFRRFGMPAFSVYSWHRFWAIPAVILVSYIAGVPSYESGSITSTSLNWAWTILTIIAVWIFIHLLLKIWEKKGFIGGIEWMMSIIAGFLGKNMRKTKGSLKENPRWWELGKMDMERIFYNPIWIDIIARDEKYKNNKKDSKLAKKMAIIGLCILPFSLIALGITQKAIKDEGINEINRKAKKFSLIGLVIFIIVLIALSVINLEMLGLNF